MPRCAAADLDDRAGGGNSLADVSRVGMCKRLDEFNGRRTCLGIRDGHESLQKSQTFGWVELGRVAAITRLTCVRL